ncbi:MAG TPA: RNA polymerase subunit sigma-24 [Actinobacteria bacterium]|nr:RNA polymerase subunit sigma-24 [Actinomycetota bacterium]
MSDQLGVRVNREIEAVWRIEAPKLIAALTHLTHDLGTAEELAQESLVAALEQWPRDGIPRKPGAWLLTTARRRGIDQIRRRENLASKYQLIGEVLRDRAHEQDLLDAVDRIEDDVLRLVFVTCHPVLPVESRVALALRVLGGLSVADIASAFLVTESAMAARITRAKKALRRANVPFEVPQGGDRARRVPDVLEVIYLIFNEGYSATSGDDAMRPLLCDEAIRLGRVIAELMPGESEVHGLLALMQLQASRASARSDRDGRPILLLDQDRRRWDRTLITLGMRSLARAYESSDTIGAYTLEASIASCHARARRPEDTDWEQIVGYYDLLRVAKPSPVVELNRAVAVGKAQGPSAGLIEVEKLLGNEDLLNYHLLSSARGHFLAELGRNVEASAQFEKAAGLTANESDRRFLRQRAQELAD